MPNSEWFVYIIEADDGSYYTGISTDPQRRIEEHRGGGPTAARYFRGRKPRQLVLVEGGHDRGSALRRESAIKNMDRRGKEELVAESACDA